MPSDQVAVADIALRQLAAAGMERAARCDRLRRHAGSGNAAACISEFDGTGSTYRHPVSAQYHLGMQIVSCTGVEGKVVLDRASLPEGTVVTVYAQEPGNVVRLPLHLQAEIEAALEEADREEGISAEELFAQLRKYR